MRFLTDDVAQALVDLEINNRKLAMKLCTTIKPVIKRFDGKKLNRRLENSLKEIDSGLYVSTHCGRVSIWWRVDKDCVPRSEFSVEYISDDKLQISIPVYDNNKMREKNLLDCNERIIADVLLNAIEERKTEMKKEISELQNKRKQVDKYRSRIKKAKELLESIDKEVPTEIREYFGLTYAVRQV